MTLFTDLSSRFRSLDKWQRLLLAGSIVALGALLIAGYVAVSYSQTTNTKPNGIGRGGADPFWVQMTNRAQSGGATSAIAWARSFEAGQVNAGLSARYSGLCLEFVANAYGASYSTPYDTAWSLARASALKDAGNPAAAPKGALMFFDLTKYKIPEGHVGISLGGATMISALEHSSKNTTNVQVTAVVSSDSYWWSTYRGWAWPPNNWGTLAAQAAGSDQNSGKGGTSNLPTIQLEEEFDIVRYDPRYGYFLRSYGIFLDHFPPNTSIPVTCYDSAQQGFDSFTMKTDGFGSAINVDECIVTGSKIDHWVIAGGVESNHFTDIPGGADEVAGSVAHTWTDYLHAGGTQGPLIEQYEMVYVSCRINGFKVADGNTWWYRIAASPWNDMFYASADAFYNNGQTSGSLKGTPPVDSRVQLCDQSATPTPTTATPTPAPGPTVTPALPTVTPTLIPTVTPTPRPSTYPETTGSYTHTWSNYTNAGGTEGPTIPPYQTIQIACKLTGFRVADGNTWWYRIAQSPWSGQFYASADAFYNNGQTQGSLQGTPWVDTNVPNC